MQIKNCQPILGLTKYCKPITGFKSLTCKLFLGRNKPGNENPCPSGQAGGKPYIIWVRSSAGGRTGWRNHH
jgi:hypothetical protein